MENQKSTIKFDPEIVKEVERTLQRIKWIRQGYRPMPWQLWDYVMSKQNIVQRNASKFGKKYSHTGNKPLVKSLHDDNVMVTQKVRASQERKQRQ